MTSPGPFLATAKQRQASSCIDFAVAVLASGFIALIADSLDLRTNEAALFGATWLAYGFAAIAYAQGRSVGNAVLDVRVFSADGSPATPIQALLRGLVGAAPFFYLASVNGRDEKAALAVIAVKLLADWLLVDHTTTRQSVADRVARTLVIRMPPLQPLRTPAAPMFSATDREFGLPPRWLPDGERGDAGRPGRGDEDARREAAARVTR